MHIDRTDLAKWSGTWSDTPSNGVARVFCAVFLMVYGMDQDNIKALISTRQSGFTLPQAFYLDSDVYALEFEQIWRSGWLFVAHDCEIPSVGDYLTWQVGDDSILILRDDEEIIRAFYNICRHRGTRLCSQEQGHVGRIVCPYHQWTYNRSGKLCSARGMDSDLNLEEWSLLPLAVTTAAGMIYVSLAENPPPFESVGDQIEKAAGPQGFQRAKVAYAIDYEIQANWKLVWENNRECYHCNVNHPQYIRANFDHYNRDDTSDSIKLRMAKQLEQNESRWAETGLLATHRSTGMASFPDPDHDDGWCAINRTVLVEDYLSETMDGQLVAPLMGDYRDPHVGTLRMRTMPNMWNHSSCDHAVTTRLLPAGADKTLARVVWLVDQDAVEGQDYTLDKLLPFWQLTSEQDWALCHEAQRGISSRAYRPGPLSTYKEWNVEAFIGWYLDKLANHP